MAKKSETHSPNFEKIKYYYTHHYWTITMVRNVTKKGTITPEEYKEITGEDYEAWHRGK